MSIGIGEEQNDTMSQEVQASQEETTTPQESRAEEQEDMSLPEFVNGMRVELLKEDNSLLFVGKLTVIKKGVLQVAPDEGERLPGVLYNTKIKLRGNHQEGDIFTIHATVCGSTAFFWRLDNLKTLRNKNQRGYFRQNVDVTAVFSLVDDNYEVEAWLWGAADNRDVFNCRVLDISGSGVRIYCDQRCDIGSRLLLTGVRLVDEESEFSFLCEIMRENEGRRGYYEYGCQFVEMGSRAQNRLIQTIFSLQRKDMQRRRGNGY